jgi:hypothetical protein
LNLRELQRIRALPIARLRELRRIGAAAVAFWTQKHLSSIAKPPFEGIRAWDNLSEFRGMFAATRAI